ncbi:murein biosynthesis integral membrane protein MurJ [Natranaerovirga hydrolytica]|uniref:Murein biosynthesis integral membrane protein MurJ n=1 Tax=Natranaerovirga hydrolytica TaxID=680378 RepID=A0A4R1MKT5_9FIRM|nr:lipid II flippase MurJ [Natranaerovirga hydrolytica]TCK93458.1 murein biosynthesis integral membrane protein MurJ [Natranaerovirga hydrolytica]
MDKKNNIINVASLVIMLTLIGKVLAFARDALIASRVGTSFEADAYFFANNLTTMSFVGVAASILTALIPVFVRIRKIEGKEAFFKFANNVINIFMCIAVALIIVVNIGAFIVRQYTSDPQIYLTSQIVSGLVISIFFITITYVFIAILQSMNQFGAAAMVSYPFNAVMIVYIFFFLNVDNLLQFAYFTAFAWGMQAAILIPTLRKNQYKYAFILNIKEKRLNQIWQMIIPIMIITMVHQNNVNIDNLFSYRFLGEGVASGIYYANTIYVAIVTVIIYGIMTVAYPKISEKNLVDTDSMNTYVLDIISIIGFIILPLTIGFTVLGKEIITMIYGRGEFGASSIQLTTTVLTRYAIGALGLGILEVLSKTYFASKRFLPPLLAILSINVTNIIGTSVLRYYGVGGIALSTSVSMLLGSFVFLGYYIKKHNIEISKSTRNNFFKMVAASLGMLLLIYPFQNILKTILDVNNSIHNLIIIFSTTLIGLLTYIVINVLVKESNTKNIYNQLVNRKRENNV